jgi:hypothetical protein
MEKHEYHKVSFIWDMLLCKHLAFKPVAYLNNI